MADEDKVFESHLFEVTEFEHPRRPIPPEMAQQSDCSVACLEGCGTTDQCTDTCADTCVRTCDSACCGDPVLLVTDRNLIREQQKLTGVKDLRQELYSVAQNPQNP